MEETIGGTEAMKELNRLGRDLPGGRRVAKSRSEELVSHLRSLARTNMAGFLKLGDSRPKELGSQRK